LKLWGSASGFPGIKSPGLPIENSNMFYWIRVSAYQIVPALVRFQYHWNSNTCLKARLFFVSLATINRIWNRSIKRQFFALFHALWYPTLPLLGITCIPLHRSLSTPKALVNFFCHGEVCIWNCQWKLGVSLLWQRVFAFPSLHVEPVLWLLPLHLLLLLWPTALPLWWLVVKEKWVFLVGAIKYKGGPLYIFGTSVDVVTIITILRSFLFLRKYCATWCFHSRCCFLPIVRCKTMTGRKHPWMVFSFPTKHNTPLRMKHPWHFPDVVDGWSHLLLWNWREVLHHSGT
jgi:hypothetical protein